MDRHALGLHWDLQPGLIFLNHGSFGLAPRELLQWRGRLLRRIERDPVHFLTEQLQPQLDQARSALAVLVGALPEQLAFVPSTTYGLNELLQRLELPAGSEVLYSDHTYNATLNLLRFAAEQRGWNLRQVELPLPLQHPSEVVDAFAAAWTPATRLLVLDHVTSPSALVLPIAELIALARERGARVIIDGAHGPGCCPLQLDALRPDAYVGNLHKWLCCPRGSAFLWVDAAWADRLRPLVVSHGANAPLAEGRSRFHLEHDWIGTADPTPWLALPEALRLLGSGPHLLQRLQAMQRMAMAIEPLLLEALGGAGCPAQPLAPASARAAMVAVPLPALSVSDGAALQRRLLARGFQVPVIAQQPHQATARQFLRVSCFAYNQLSDGIALAEALPAALADQAARG